MWAISKRFSMTTPYYSQYLYQYRLSNNVIQKTLCDSPICYCKRHASYWGDGKIKILSVFLTLGNINVVKFTCGQELTLILIFGPILLRFPAFAGQ